MRKPTLDHEARNHLVAMLRRAVEALEWIRDHTYLDADPPELRAQNESTHRQSIRALADLDGGRVADPEALGLLREGHPHQDGR